MNSTRNSAENKATIPVLVGPTASGKTAVAFRLAEQIPGLELISADSRQIYRHLRLGTDKPSPEEIEKYSIRLVDFVEPGQRYTAFDFIEDARRAITLAREAGQKPFVVGGTGLYIKALIEGMVEIPDDDLAIRERLEKEAVEKGPEYLHRELEKIDPMEAVKIHPHNIKRLVRALEIFYITGKSKSELIYGNLGGENEYDYRAICLMPPREILYRRINERVDRMIAGGLPDEIKMLIEAGLKEDVAGVNVIGYNELFRHIDGELSLDEAVSLIKINTRHFAKRQITWYRGMADMAYLDGPEAVAEYFLRFWAEK